MTASSLAIIMFLLILVGFAARKMNIVDNKFGENLSIFLYDFIFPAVIIQSMLVPFEKSEQKNLLLLMLISVATMIAMFCIGILFNFLSRKKDALSGIIKFALMFPNFTFMAFPVMETLFPERGLFYISMYTIPTRILIYVIGPLLVKPRSESVSAKQLLKDGLKAILTPPVIAVPVGLILYFTGLHLPEIFTQVLGYLAKVATPLGMAVTGILLAEASFSSMFKEVRLYILTVLRLIVAPVITYFMLLPFSLDPVIFKISVLYSALPIAAATTVLAIQYKGDAENAAGSVFLTTVLSVLTVPICAYILELVV